MERFRKRLRKNEVTIVASLAQYVAAQIVEFNTVCSSIRGYVARLGQEEGRRFCGNVKGAGYILHVQCP